MGAGARDGILISGFYGFGNLGDEAILAGMVAGLRARLGRVPIAVLSANPSETARLHGVEGVPRADFRAIVRSMRRARLFLSGGGSLVQDVTSARSALYYLGVLRLARMLAPRTMVFAQGVGPVRRPAIRALTRHTLARTDSLTVRDTGSASLLRALGVRREITLAADPALLLPPEVARAAPEGNAADPHPGRAREAPVVGVVVRPWQGDAYVAPLGAALRRLAAGAGAAVVVLPFHPALDAGVSRRMADAAGGRVMTLPPDPSAALAVCGRLAMMVTLRLHAAIFGAMAGVPAVGVAYDPKVPAFFHELELSGAVVGLDAGEAGFFRALGDRWDSRADAAARLPAQVADLRRRAGLAVDEAARLYASA